MPCIWLCHAKCAFPRQHVGGGSICDMALVGQLLFDLPGLHAFMCAHRNSSLILKASLPCTLLCLVSAGSDQEAKQHPVSPAGEKQLISRVIMV